MCWRIVRWFGKSTDLGFWAVFDITKTEQPGGLVPAGGTQEVTQVCRKCRVNLIYLYGSCSLRFWGS